jgi:hypothetical protein
VTLDQKHSDRSYQAPWDRTEVLHRPEEPAERSSAGYAVAFLMLLAIAVLCVVGFLIVRLLLPDSSPLALPQFVTWTPSPAPEQTENLPSATFTAPPSGEALLTITPEQGYVNTLITVIGEGWWPGEPVFVFLRSRDEGEGRGYSYAAAVAGDDGRMRTAFTFPNEMRWIGQEWADVIARGSRSEREARTRFTLVPPTATATPLLPTARPTRPPTDTPVYLPTDTPLPSPTPSPDVIITDWRGEYYANAALSGGPVLIRNDVDIAFDWGEASPGGEIPLDGFSIRWTQRIRFAEGTYRFIASADDGVRFWIDDQLFVDQWHDQPLTAYSADVYLPRGRHTLRLEYYENVGNAAVSLTWQGLEEATATPTPTLTPLPPATATETPIPTAPPPSPPPLPQAWHAEYYDNPTLSGQPVRVRDDPAVNFNWGQDAPADGVPRDNFSVRWTRDVWTPGGAYQFSLEPDDGVRFWIDRALLLDEWHTSTGDTYEVTAYLTEGVHRLQIEYYEETLDARMRFESNLVP